MFGTAYVNATIMLNFFISIIAHFLPLANNIEQFINVINRRLDSVNEQKCKQPLTSRYCTDDKSVTQCMYVCMCTYRIDICTYRIVIYDNL